MLGLAAGLAGFVTLWWITQLALCLGYRRAAEHCPATPLHEAELPTFVVFIPVRGLDPTLTAAIRGVTAVDYPRFTVRILFDSREDAAWSAVEEELRRLNDSRISVHVIEHPRETCSVLCHNLVEAIGQLGDAHDLIAICAADMIVPRNWLRSMAHAMADPGVSATLGNRWYLPPTTSAGTLVRWQWNAGSVVLMRLWRIPWSGGMALRVRESRSNGLLARWAAAMVEDASVSAHFAREPERLRFVPGLLVTHDDEIGLRASYRFIRRQLLWSRLYSPRWLLIVGHASCGALATFGFPILALFAAARGNLSTTTLSLLAFALYQAAMLFLLRIVEAAAGDSPAGKRPRFSGLPPWAVLAATPLTQAVYFAATCSAAWARVVEWRGIRYAIRGSKKIQRLDYQPCREK